jgi:hypothetical protein
MLRLLDGLGVFMILKSFWKGKMMMMRRRRLKMKKKMTRTMRKKRMKRRMARTRQGAKRAKKKSRTEIHLEVEHEFTVCVFETIKSAFKGNFIGSRNDDDIGPETQERTLEHDCSCARVYPPWPCSADQRTLICTSRKLARLWVNYSTIRLAVVVFSFAELKSFTATQMAT